MANTSGDVHVLKVSEGEDASATLGEGSALTLRRILFMYAGLAAAVLSHPRNLTLASVAVGGVPHSVRRRAFLQACARKMKEPRREAMRITIR
jgi:hypothetical protein